MFSDEMKTDILEGRVKPKNNYVFLQRLKKPSNSVIILAETMLAASNWCRVLAVPDMVDDGHSPDIQFPPDVKRGDFVFVRPCDGVKLFSTDPSIQITKYSQVECIWEGSEEELLSRANHV